MFVLNSYFIIPLLAHTVVKALFVAFGQSAGTVQAIALIIIEAAALITTGKLPTPRLVLLLWTAQF